MVEPSSNPDHASLEANSSSGMFVGRQQVMADLRAALNDTISGQGRVVMMAGEPGIGKTRLAQELASTGVDQGMRVFWGRCYEGLGAPPFWPWLQLIREYVQQTTPETMSSDMGPGAADIAEIVPEIHQRLSGLEVPPSLEPEQARFRLFDSITTFLRTASQTNPFMIVLDDLQWADEPSLLLLEFLSRGLAEAPVLVIGTYRDIELSRQHPLANTLGELNRERRFERVLIGGLDQKDVAQFIEVTSGLPPPTWLIEAVQTQTEGNPLFVTEVVRLLLQEGDLTGENAITQETWTVRIPEGVKEVIGRRLNRLSEICNEALTVASIIGREFELRQLLPVLDGMSEASLLEVLEEALAARVLEELPRSLGRYQFTHALIQETLAEELSLARRVRLHARIAESLEALYGLEVEAHAAELAHHFSEAEEVLGSANLARYCLLAGEQALATYACDSAQSHFQMALEARSSKQIDEETATLLFGLGRAQAATLQRREMGQAVETLRRAFDYYAEAGDVGQAVAVAEYPIAGFGFGHPSGMGPMIEKSLQMVESNSHEEGRLLCRHGRVLGMEQGDYDGAADAFQRSLAIAEREGDISLEMRTLNLAANVDVFHLRQIEALAKSRRATELALRHEELTTEVPSRFWSANSMRAIGRFEDEERNLKDLLAAAERLGDRYWLVSALWRSETSSSLRGDWQTAREFSDRAISIFSTDYRLIPTRVQLEYESGDVEAGAAFINQLLDLTRLNGEQPTNGYGATALILPLVAEIAGSEDYLEIARAIAETIIPSPLATPNIILNARIGLALMAVQLSDRKIASEQYAALNDLCSQRSIHMSGANSGPVIDRVLGRLADILDYPDQAAEHFEESLSFCRKAGYRPELAWTCFDYAGMLLQRSRDGDRDKASLLLNESNVLADELGMPSLLKRVTEKVQSLQRLPEIAQANPAGLSQRKVEVLRLIADCKTDREIAEELTIAPRTATTHVGNILNKTDSANRAEAAAYAARQGLA